MATYQGGDISIAPFLQGVGNFLIAKQQEAEQELKAERARADKLFADMQETATKINPAGALSSDQPIIMKYYDEDIKGNIIRANIARQKGDNKSYLEHIAKANEATIKVTQLIGDSKAKAKAASDFFSKFKPEEWEEGVVEEFNKWLSKPVTESGGIDAIMTNPKFQRRIDDSKVGADIDKMFNDLFKNYGKFKEVKKLSSTTAGGRSMDKVADIVELNKDLFYEGLLNIFSTPKGKAYYTRMGYGASPEEAALNLVAEYEQGGKFSREESLRDVRYDAPKESDGSSVGGVVNNWSIPFVNTEVVADRYSGVNIPNVTITKNTPAIDLSTGQPVTNTPDYLTSGTVVGIASVPVSSDQATSFGLSRSTRERVLSREEEQAIRQRGGNVMYKDKAILNTDYGAMLVDLDAIERANNVTQVRKEIKAFKSTKPTPQPQKSGESIADIMKRAAGVNIK